MSSSDDYFGIGVDLSVIIFARPLAMCIYDRDLAQARRLVEDLTREEVMAMTRLEFSDFDDDDYYDCRSTLLRRAVCCRNVEFVKFLLAECHADVDKCCADETPLCHVARYPQIEMVRLLIDHGANVNATGYKQSTPVFIASGTGDLNLVRYLVETGANVHLPDIDGETSLMQSVHAWVLSVTISQYLLEHGSSVNAVDNLGNSALHYAARVTHEPVTTVKPIVDLLQRQEAGSAIRNKYGDDVLQPAALHGSPEIIDHLIDKLKPTSDRRADLYSLVASGYIDKHTNFTRAIDLWKKSVYIEMETSRDAPTPDPNPAYNGAVEARDLESLDAIAGDKDALCTQALICRQRILGSSHPDTIHWLSNRALHYARKSDSYQRGIDLYGYASALCDWTSLDPIKDLYLHEEFVRLLQAQEKNGGVRFDDAAAPLRILVSLSKSDYINCRSYITDEILWTSVNVIDLMCRLKSSDVEARSLRRLVRALLQSDRKTVDGATVLHRVVAPCSGGDNSGAVLDELLEAGADVDEPDSQRNTPLHYAADCYAFLVMYGYQTESARSVIDQLLTHGAHVDIRNDRGETAVYGLPPHVDKMQYTTLQCLAARAIRQHGVEYRHILPESLIRFVDRH